jgi:phospholipase/carboxylesterase
MMLPAKDALSNFVHVVHDHGKTKTLFLLHGTGGDEHDLIPLVAPLKDKFNFVGLRGNIVESGMRRFFARKAMGVFDQQSIKNETDKLAAFLATFYEDRALEVDMAVFVGFSNGANMILATLLRHAHVIQNAALLHAMLPFEPPDVDLAGRRVLVTYGLSDNMIPPGEGERVAAALELRGAQVQVFAHGGGHQITAEEQATLFDFLALV